MYVYAEQRAELFTEQGVATLLKVYENVKRLLGEAGAVRAVNTWKDVGDDTGTMSAALDYLVEKGRIREVTDGSAWGQDRVFVAVR